MISLDSAISNARSFLELAPLVRLMQEEISFLGWRYIYLPGYEGRLAIDSLSERVLEVAHATLGFGVEERAVGREIKGHVNRLYRESDQRLDGKNFITFVLCSLREFFDKHIMHNGLGARHMWRALKRIAFDQYTREQYEQVFGRAPIGPGTVVNHGGTQIELWGPPAPINPPDILITL